MTQNANQGPYFYNENYLKEVRMCISPKYDFKKRGIRNVRSNKVNDESAQH